jgi:hypothetical protein
MRVTALLLALATALLAFAAGPATASPDRDAALVAELKARRLGLVAFEDAPLEDVLRWLRVATGVNLHVKRPPIAKAGLDLDAIRVTLRLEDVSAWQVLEMVLEPEGLAVQVRDNVVHVTTRQDAMGRPVTRLYAISHITWQRIDFIAPEINLHPSDFTPVDEYEPEVVDESDPLTTGDAVAELVREIVHPDDWDTEGWSIRANDRFLVVRAPRAVHTLVARAIEQIASLK